MNTYDTCISPTLDGFPCLQTRKLLIFDQPEHKDNFSPKENNTYTQICPNLTLKLLQIYNQDQEYYETRNVGIFDISNEMSWGAEYGYAWPTVGHGVCEAF